MMLRELYIIAYILEALIADWYFERLFVSGRLVWMRIGCVAAGYGILFGISFFDTVSVNTTSFLIINVLTMMVAYQTGFVHALFHALIMSGFMSLTEIAGAGLLGILSSNFSISDTYSLSMLYLILISKPLYFLGLFIVSFFMGGRNRRKEQTDSVFNILVLIPMCSFIVMVFLLKLALDLPLTGLQERLVIGSALLLLVLNIIVYLVYGISQRRSEQLMMSHLELQKQHDEKTYYEKLLEQDENQKMLIHDIRNHVNALYSLIHEGDFMNAEKYVTQLYYSTDLKEMIRFSSNNTLNLILNRYMNQFMRNKIQFFVDVRNEAIDFVEAVDLTCLLSNLLDNAYEATYHIDNASVDLRIRKTVIVMTNSSHNMHWVREGELVKTTKADKLHHGYGNKSMKRITRKYHGDMEMYYNEEEGRFHTIIHLVG